MQFGGLNATAVGFIGLVIGAKICFSLARYFFHGAVDIPVLVFRKFFTGFHFHKHSETGDGISITYKTRFGQNFWTVLYHAAALSVFALLIIAITTRNADGGYWLPVSNHELLNEGELIRYDGGTGKIRYTYTEGDFTYVSIDRSDYGEDTEELLQSEILYRYIPSEKNPLSVPGRAIRFVGIYASALAEEICETFLHLTGA